MSIDLYETPHDQAGRPIREAHHRFIQFPGGEAHLPAAGASDWPIQVAYLRGASGDDLMKLAMWADAMRRVGHKRIALIPYLPGARQDRGIPLGAKVYADFLNSLGLEQIICFDPHSDVMPALINNLTVVGLNNLSSEFWHSLAYSLDPYDEPFAGVICPDVGARKRAELVANQLDVPVYQAMKHRDFVTGKLSGFTCEPLPEGVSFLVVDDICDGGGTFLGLAEAINVPREQLALWVSHGIFSAGFEKLSANYGAIHTTDSHPGSDSHTYPALVKSLFGTLINHITLQES
jgi:ribose-phosphate pyrophosphokinase